MRKEKVRATDYTNMDRPINRSSQYFDIFKHRFLELMKISLLQTVFNMPLIVDIVLFYVALRNATNLNSLMTIFLIDGGALIIALPFTYVGMMGSFYCLKQLTFGDGEFASSSFFKGLLEEWKKGALIGFLQGISASIAVIGYFFSRYYLSQFDNIIAGFGIAISIIQGIVMLIVSFYTVSQSLIYTNRLRDTYKNSFIMTLIRFPYNLLFVIIYPGIIIALFCIMEITMFVGVGLLVFFSVFGHLIWMENTLVSFDKFINKENHPEIYRKGLREVIKEE